MSIDINVTFASRQDLTFSGFLKGSDTQVRLVPLFIESSPGPVKYAAYLLGLCESETRLPLVEINENTKKSIANCLKDLSLI